MLEHGPYFLGSLQRQPHGFEVRAGKLGNAGKCTGHAAGGVVESRVAHGNPRARLVHAAVVEHTRQLC